MSDGPVSILDGNTFVVSDRSGDIDASPTEPTGFFSFDTRFLSRWVLTLDGERLSPLGVDDLDYFASRFFLVPSTGTIYVNATLSAIRRREVGDTCFSEEISVLNHDRQPVEINIRLDVGSDFADLFEVKDKQAKKGTYFHRIEGGALVVGYRRDTFVREVMVKAEPAGEVDDRGISFVARIPAHGQWRTALTVTTSMPMAGTGGGHHHHRTSETKLRQWMAAAPSLVCDDDALRATYRRSLVDLAALRFSTRAAPHHALPAAGLPWFMTIFGRDSILTSLQALPFAPELAVTTLQALGERQGVNIDDFRDEDPGRILHEQRYGELTAFEERPHSPYFGSADATPLYVVLLDEYERWTGDTALVRSLENEARAALAWIDDYADLQGNGYISYQRRNKETGLENQCWKDSWDSIAYRDGTLPGFPRATCELQGYAYDAKVRGARLARTVWRDPAYATRLEEEAAALKRRFNRDFWIASEGYFALALADDGRQVDSLTSNIGHLLWSGIVDRSKARSVVRHLMSDRLFSGWGIRTMAVGEARYNPIGYHVGTVWPFDNSIIAWGLRRYGYREEAARVAAGILDAATYFGGRLPEAFSGYPRGLTGYPVPYPTACSPQAWSTGAPRLLLRTMLGLEPDGDHLLIDPAVPVQFERLELLDIRGRWGRIDAFGRGRVATPAHGDRRN
ncbi:MAG TPA: glycogen debranching N-terminal domain-containing protein [Acidimicrobiales bacterium]|nr:glycogen debranching N-terminal domain-containing protein [Acidimicrobiales bacterium]